MLRCKNDRSTWAALLAQYHPYKLGIPLPCTIKRATVQTVIRKKVKRFEIVSFARKLHSHLTIANMYFSGTMGATMGQAMHAKRGCV
jgi:hypothetical protein